jgi:hypothetical protein
MSQPVDMKLFIGNIIHLDIKVLMNTVKIIDKSAGFYPDKSKKFGFIHISTPEKCNEIYEKLLNCSYKGSYIHVERPKAYIQPKIEPKIEPKIDLNVLRPYSNIKSSLNYTYPKSSFNDVRKNEMDARIKAIEESDRIRDMVEAEKVTKNYNFKDPSFAETIDEIDENDPRYDAWIDSFFAPAPSTSISTTKRVIYNPEEMD